MQLSIAGNDNIRYEVLQYGTPNGTLQEMYRLSSITPVLQSCVVWFGLSVLPIMCHSDEVKGASMNLISPATWLFISHLVQVSHKDINKIQHYRPFLGRIQQWRVDFPHKGTILHKTLPWHHNTCVFRRPSSALRNEGRHLSPGSAWWAWH